MRATNTSTTVLKNASAFNYCKVICDGQNLTTRCMSFEYSTSIDNKGYAASLAFSNHPDQNNLLPGSGGTYTNTLKPNKLVQVYLCGKTTKGIPATNDSDWDLVFEGKTGDDVRSGRTVDQQDTISISCRGKIQKQLQDKNIIDERAYPVGARGSNEWEISNSAATASASVIAQSILDDNSTGLTLRIAADPSTTITPYILFDKSVWDAVQELFVSKVYDVREKFWAATNSFQLVLSNPQTVGSSDTITSYYTTDLNYTDGNLRNLIRVYYQARDYAADIGAGAQVPRGAPQGVLYVQASDATSISTYDERAMKTTADSTARIDTYQAALDYANQALADLKDIAPTDSISSRGVLYHLEPYDTITLSGGAQAGTLAITNISFSVRPGGIGETQIQGLRRSVVNEHLNHIKRDTRTRPPSNDANEKSSNITGGKQERPSTPSGLTATAQSGRVSFTFNKVTTTESGRSSQSISKYNVYYKSAYSGGIATIDIANASTYDAVKRIDSEIFDIPTTRQYSGGAWQSQYVATRVTAIDYQGRESLPSTQIEAQSLNNKFVTLVAAGVITSPTVPQPTQVWASVNTTVAAGHAYVVTVGPLEDTQHDLGSAYMMLNKWGYRFWGDFENGGTNYGGYLAAGTYATLNLYIYSNQVTKGIVYNGATKFDIDSNGNVFAYGELKEARAEIAMTPSTFQGNPKCFWQVFDIEL